MPKLGKEAQSVLQVFNRLHARPGDCLHYVTLVRNGMVEEDVEPGVRECVRLGYVIDRIDCAELTEVGWKAIGWTDRPRESPADR